MIDQAIRRRGAITALAVCLPLAAPAQEDTLDEIVITAQKREQSVLDVPMTADIFGALDIENTGALDMAEMQDYIPGFEVGFNPTQAGITMRGVSSANISSGGDPSVATFYDDVYVPRAATQVLFSDMARVEVLKGPQGTLYGRNAAAGVVNMVPNQPRDGTEGFVKARIGNHNLMRIEAMGNMALTDNLFVRANILSNQRDGYTVNVIPGGREPGEQDNLAARIAALWEVSDATSVQFSYDHDELDNSAFGAYGLSPWGECPNDPFCGRVRNDVVDGTEGRDMKSITAKLFHDFNDQWGLKFVTNYREFAVINRQDEDGTAEVDRYLDTDNIEDSDIQYNELQFSFAGERINAVFGANYSKENTSQVIPVNTNADSAMRAVTANIWNSLSDPEQQFVIGLIGRPLDHVWNPLDMAILLNAFGLPVTPQDVALTGDLFYDQLDFILGDAAPIVGPSLAGQPWSEIYFNDGDFTNWGIYGDVDYAVTDRLNVLVGLRYSKDDKTFSWRNPPNTLNLVRPGTADLAFRPIPGYTQARTGTLTASDSWSKVSGRAVVNFSMTDSSMLYASYSTGYKSGGFDSLDVTTSNNPLRPEESTNIEVGMKGDFLNNRLRATLSIFDMNVDGRQRTVDMLLPGETNAIPRQNSGEQDVEGVELVMNFQVTDSLRAGFLTTWRDSKATWEPFFNAVGDLIEDGDASVSSTDTDYTLWLDYNGELAGGSINAHIDYIFNTDNSELDPGVINPNTPGFGIDRRDVNARIAWTNSTDKFTVALWGKNLTDQRRVRSVSDRTTYIFGTPFARIYPPRTYGIELSYNF